MVKLFAVGFPRDMGEDELLKLFNEFGNVASLTLVTDQETGNSKGYAFIHYLDETGARLAIKEMNGSLMADRTIYVRYAEENADALNKDIDGLSPNPKIDEINTLSSRKKRPRIKR